MTRIHERHLILNYLRDHPCASVAEICQSIGESNWRVRNLLYSMHREGSLERVRPGRYRLTKPELDNKAFYLQLWESEVESVNPAQDPNRTSQGRLKMPRTN